MLDCTGNLEPGNESVAVGHGMLALSDVERWLTTEMVHMGTLSGTSCSPGWPGVELSRGTLLPLHGVLGHGALA